MIYICQRNMADEVFLKQPTSALYSVNLLGCCQRENYAIYCGNPWG